MIDALKESENDMSFNIRIKFVRALLEGLKVTQSNPRPMRENVPLQVFLSVAVLIGATASRI